MHRCPQCDYAFGPLPGVPVDRFGEFTAAVRCPECSFEVPKGARLVVGASMEAGAQPLTTRRRTTQLLIALAPMAFVLKMGIEGVAGLVGNGLSGSGMLDAGRALGLVGFGVVGWFAWRRWRPDPEADGRAAVSYDVRWMCVPGEIRVVSASRFATGRSRAAAEAGESATPPPTDQARIERIAREDIRSVVANSPKERGGRWRTDDRAVACVTVFAWRRDSSGRRSDLRTLAVFVDTGADLQAAPPGRDRTVALLEAGDAVARAIRRTVGIEPADGAPSTTEPAGDHAVLAVEGSLFALPPWPSAATVPTLVVVVPAMIALTFLLVFSIATFARVSTPGLKAPVPPWLPWVGAIAIAIVAIAAALWWWLVRRARLRHLARCRWDVGRHGIRVTERSIGRKGNLVAEHVRDVPGDRIAIIEPILTHGRLRLVASDRARRELASVTLDEIPEGGAQHLASRMEALIAGARSARP